MITREDCFYCVRKHLAQAQILLDESSLGYPVHKWLAVGHMAEAESEVMKYSLDFAKEIRKTRTCIMGQVESKDCKSVFELLEEACTIAEAIAK